MRQITSSVSYLPLLEDRCSFEILVYTDKQAEVPITWENSDPRMVANSQQVKVWATVFLLFNGQVSSRYPLFNSSVDSTPTSIVWMQQLRTKWRTTKEIFSNLCGAQGRIKPPQHFLKNGSFRLEFDMPRIFILLQGSNMDIKIRLKTVHHKLGPFHDET